MVGKLSQGKDEMPRGGLLSLRPPVKARALSPAHLTISPLPIQSQALSALVWIKELLGIPSESILYVRSGSE